MKLVSLFFLALEKFYEKIKFSLQSISFIILQPSEYLNKTNLIVGRTMKLGD